MLWGEKSWFSRSNGNRAAARYRSLILVAALATACGGGAATPASAPPTDPRIAWFAGTWRTTAAVLSDTDNIAITIVIDPYGAVTMTGLELPTGRPSERTEHGRLEATGSGVVAIFVDPAGTTAPIACRLTPLTGDSFASVNFPGVKEGCGAPHPIVRVR